MNNMTPKDQAAALAAIAAEVPERRRTVGRRGFLTTGAAAGGGLMIGLGMAREAVAARTRPTTTTTTTTTTAPAAAVPAVTTATVNVFVVIGSDNSIRIITPGGEMGQGINAGLAQVLAEELPLDWKKVLTVPAPYGTQYGRGASKSQVTGGSNNMRGWFNLMLQAGATAREMLLAAARAQFPSAPTPLKAVAGVVQDANGATLANYGALAQAAATATVTQPVPLLSASGYKVIGQKLPRPDVPLKVNGRAIFGMDVHPNNTPGLTGMVFAAVRFCPTMGGTVKTLGSAPTGSQVVNLGNAIAATGPTTWKARQNAKAVSVSWTLPTSTALNSVDSSALATQAQSLMTTATPLASGGTLAVANPVLGDVTAGMAAASKTLTMTYSLPFLAHAYMEVLNCTVKITKDTAGTITSVEMWCPTQAPDRCAKTVASLTGITDMSKIKVTSTYMGGGLGRKIEQDYVTQAVKVAQTVNKPVKLTWFREEDFQMDWYRPSALSRVQVGLDANGAITAWSNRIVAPSLSRAHGVAPTNGLDGVSIGRANELPYAVGSRLVEFVEQITGMQIGYWRSVGESISCFVVESAIDECAIAAGRAPYQYRRELMVQAGKTAEVAVLDKAAEMSGWAGAATSGRKLGIAYSPGFGSMCAMVAELALDAAGAVKVVQIFAAVDCGIAVNPDQVVSQMEGAILHGYSAALWQQVKFDKGICQVKNFGDYKMGRMAGTPKISVAIVSQGSPLGGMGEVGVPGVAPALANAYAKLTGTRKRALPLGIVTAPANDD